MRQHVTFTLCFGWCRLGAQGKAVLLPQQGPLIIGAVEDADIDVILDAPTVSGRHARLEIVPTGSGTKSTDFRSAPHSTQILAFVRCWRACPLAAYYKCVEPMKVVMYRCILTDLGSTNGTWVNRAQLRPHRDTQIRARDTVAFGDSRIAFRLVALEPDNIPTALETAADVLDASCCSTAATEVDIKSSSKLDGGLEEKHSELSLLAQSLGTNGAVWLQVCSLAATFWVKLAVPINVWSLCPLHGN